MVLPRTPLPTNQVLIGPCGIETLTLKGSFFSSFVLIGPCGIETKYGKGVKVPAEVLIGPCGIETSHADKAILHEHSINWTLRN